MRIRTETGTGGETETETETETEAEAETETEVFGCEIFRSHPRWAGPPSDRHCAELA